ncbi:hypothetical protein D6853_00095 [Butyrivibrio sp. X503]|uniref:hypothetical protein n=1 Tax=Butyrivibrio sp. X503 TaxID=2364878 RepID=UPI000EAAADA0|nr:hypothetical protein [Butyrivibrio sp. X503]RKM57981.1 hypothetical protein D6853_00095 [Butyrivibrio sp. X503]
MKTRGTKILAGLMTAGMLAATGVVGIQLMGVTTTETVEFKMKDNEYGLTNSGMSEKYTGFRSFKDKIDSLPKGYGYTTFWMKGYDKEVLAIAIPDKIYNDRTASHVEIYIMRNGYVYCVGEINGLTHSLRKGSGVLYAVGEASSNPTTTFNETYLITPNQNKLFIKDFSRCTWCTDGWFYDGYVTNSNTPGVNVIDYNTSDGSQIPKKATGNDITNYEPIKFTIK